MAPGKFPGLFLGKRSSASSGLAYWDDAARFTLSGGHPTSFGTETPSRLVFFCNTQPDSGMLVLGIEGEGFWSDMKVTNDEFDGNIQFGSAQIRNKWDYDVAGRIGVAFDRALVYGKAGWAAGRFDWNWSTLGLAAGFTNQGSATLDGLLVGIGLEYAFLDNWTAKFEYDYLGFGSKNVLFTSRCSLAFCALSPIATFTEIRKDRLPRQNLFSPPLLPSAPCSEPVRLPLQTWHVVFRLA